MQFCGAVTKGLTADVDDEKDSSATGILSFFMMSMGGVLERCKDMYDPLFYLFLLKFSKHCSLQNANFPTLE